MCKRTRNILGLELDQICLLMVIKTLNIFITMLAKGKEEERSY